MSEQESYQKPRLVDITSGFALHGKGHQLHDHNMQRYVFLFMDNYLCYEVSKTPKRKGRILDRGGRTAGVVDVGEPRRMWRTFLSHP